MSLLFKNFMIANFNLKKTSLVVLLVYSLILAFIIEYQSSKPFVILGITFVGYFVIFDNNLFIKYSDLIHRYKSREIFLLPLSKKELFVLVLIESFVVSWVVSIGLIFLLRINHVGLEDNYSNWKFLTSLLFVMGVFISFSSSLSYNITEIGKKYKWYLLVKDTIVFIASLSILAVIVAFLKFKPMAYKDLAMIFIPVVFILYLSIWLLLNFKTSYFNEHVSFKRMFFSPLQDLPVILYLLAIGILYVKVNFFIS